MKSTALILWFEETGKEDTALVGGKSANLGEMLKAGFPVPPGFSVTAYAYKKFVEDTGIKDEIFRILSENIKQGKPEEYEEASKKIRELIENTDMPAEIRDEIVKAYRQLSNRVGVPNVPVAVRSSATAEDLPGASFAGQQETFLNVRGIDELLETVKKCWSSLFTPRAIFYRDQKGFEHEKVYLSVAVQKMVNSKAAGVMFTLNPVTGDRNQIVIEASWGLGETVVGGKVTPDRYIVDKETLTIIDKEIAEKTIAYERDPITGKTVKVSVPPEKANAPCLTEQEILRLAELAKKIEEHYGTPQDIEFAIDRDMDFPENIFIVQSRPETVWSQRKPPIAEEKPIAVSEMKVAIKGLPASPGIAWGKAKVVLSPEEAAERLKEKDILVTTMTNPDWVPYMKKASAIVTDEGGMTCHAAIVSRELGIPCIVGTKNATEVLRDGAEYTVDAKSGVVYEGYVEELIKPKEEAIAAPIARLSERPITATKIYVNLSLPEIAEKVFNESQPDGVGLLRAEHMMLSVGKHPRLLIETG
ncbi:MAG: phosphoenolpyruvate synthase, partial [Thermoproteota archaeon]